MTLALERWRKGRKTTPRKQSKLSDACDVPTMSGGGHEGFSPRYSTLSHSIVGRNRVSDDLKVRARCLWRRVVDRVRAIRPSLLLVPRATTASAPSGSGSCRAHTSLQGARIHTSISSGQVKITGMAFGWIDATASFGSAVRKPNTSALTSPSAFFRGLTQVVQMPAADQPASRTFIRKSWIARHVRAHSARDSRSAWTPLTSLVFTAGDSW